LIKGQLVRLLADRARMEPAQIATVYEALADLAAERLTVGSRISIEGLGTLEVVEMSRPGTDARRDAALPPEVPASDAARATAGAPSARPASSAGKAPRAAPPPKGEPRRESTTARTQTAGRRTVGTAGETSVGCLHDVVEGLIAAARGDKRTSKRGW
jgi:nucleoid DNA-binding protein